MKKGPKPTWRIIDRGAVPGVGTNEVMYACPHCLREAVLPVVGVAVAQLGSAIIFDPGPRTLPKAIQCRYCRHQFEMEA